MHKNENNISLKKRLMLWLLDPVMWYTALAMSAIMYHYREELYYQYFLVSLLFSFVLFRLFDFTQKRKLLGGAAYMAVLYAFLLQCRYCTDRGYEMYDPELGMKPMGFGLWFITPQLAMDYNAWYTRAIFLLFMVFMASVIYYFMRIRYRVFMNFLIFVIPFIIFAKEYEKMPISLIICLAASYLMLMVYCRQLNEQKNVVLIGRREIISSAGVFTVVFAIIASLIPKPVVAEDRRAIEDLIAAERFTDKLIAKLSDFRSSSSGSQFRNVDVDLKLYYVDSQYEPVRLKTRTFTEYDSVNDEWSADLVDSHEVDVISHYPADIGDPGAITDAIMQAAYLDSSFAQKYGLSEFTSYKVTIPQTWKMKPYSVYDTGQAAPVPMFAKRLTDTSYRGSFSLMETGLLIGKEEKVRNDETFTFECCKDKFFDVGMNRNIVDAVSAADYEKLLSEAWDIVTDAYFDTDDEKYDEAGDIIEAEKEAYKEALKQLDYGKVKRIQELAEQVTAGCTTDMEKARALEMYFFNNDYIYDLSYVKSQGENAESFLFNTKRGVCYEYATSMVLMARSIGIPARYCEGYNMHQAEYNSRFETNHVITTKDSHGFPELYIRGFGWMSFEPTITSGVTETVEEERGEATNNLAQSGIVILIVAAGVLLIYLLSPIVIHWLFIRINRRRAPSKAASAVMRRLARIHGLDRTNTSGEVCSAVKERTGADISEAVALFDATAYGEDKLTEADREKALEVYCTAYAALKETKRKKRRLNVRKT